MTGLSLGTDGPDRVVFLIDHFRNPLAGTEGQLLQLVKGLTARGVGCHLVVLRSSEFLEQGGFPCPFTVVGHTRIGSPKTWLALWRLGRQMRADGYRLAHTFFNDVSLLVPPTFAASGIRTLISRRDMGFWYTPLYLRLLRMTRRWISGCIANSQAVADVTMRMERIPRDSMHVIYNGLAPSDSDGGDVSRLVDLKSKGYLLIVLVANVRPIKRIEDLIEALGRLKDSDPMLASVIIGGGDASALREKAAKLGMSDRVVFLGARDDVPNCLRYADIGVLCSESEGFSNAIVEYMRAGVPTVCTNVGGNREAIEDGVTGLLYPVGDANELASHLALLAGNAELCDELGAAARRSAEVRFSVDRMVDDHLALYRAKLQGR